MGKYIDRFSVAVLLGGTLYLFFMSAFRNIPLAAASAFLALALLNRLTRPIKEKRKNRPSEGDIQSTLDTFARNDRDNAIQKITSLVNAAYPSQIDNAEICLIQRHPNGRKCDIDDVFAAWKGTGAEKIILVSLTPATDAAISLAKTLTKPIIKIIDSTALCDMLRRNPSHIIHAATAPRRARFNLSALISNARERRGKMLLIGASLCVLYTITNSLAYLIAGLSVLYISLAARGKKPENTLFTQ